MIGLHQHIANNKKKKEKKPEDVAARVINDIPESGSQSLAAMPGNRKQHRKSRCLVINGECNRLFVEPETECGFITGI